MSIFRPLHGFTCVLQRLSGMLVPGQVIFFSVVRGGSAVRVRGEFVEFSSSLVRVVWHMFPGFTIRCILEQFHFSDCSI